jgi:hypothetical protein
MDEAGQGFVNRITVSKPLKALRRYGVAERNLSYEFSESRMGWLHGSVLIRQKITNVF